MKKNKNYRIKKATTRNTKRAMSAKKRNYRRVIQSTPAGAKFVKAHNPKEIVWEYEHGPSLVIEYTEDGKVKNFNSWSKKNHQQPTTQAKARMEENKKVKNDKKELIKKILMKAGYDPTVKYTRKESKRFTRIVKENLYAKPKSVTLTNEQAEQIWRKRHNLPPKGKQPIVTAAEANKREVPKKRKFRYTIDRIREEDLKYKKLGMPCRNYAFLTNYLEADTKQDAFNKVKEIAKKWQKDTSFAGVTIQDIEGDNAIICYSSSKLAA